MQGVRWLVMLLLLASAGCFAVYAGTGQEKFKRWGLVILKWTLVAALGFFLVLAIDRW